LRWQEKLHGELTMLILAVAGGALHHEALDALEHQLGAFQAPVIGLVLVF